MANNIHHELRPLSRDQLQQLLRDLNRNRVESRKQGKQNLSYLAAWDVKATLIKVFGFGGFSADLIESQIMDAREVKQSSGNGVNNKVTAKAVVRLYIHQLGATYTEAAIAGSSQPDITEAMDMALKSAESDALKRAAIFLGTQFGLSLYNAGSLQNVVNVVLADDQRYPQITAAKAQQEIERLQQIIHGETRDGGQPTRQAVNGNGDEPVNAEGQALVERAFNMKAAKEAEAAEREQPELAGDRDE